MQYLLFTYIGIDQNG